jgi:hypothetical protein
MTRPLRDPVIEEIREVRHRISESFGHDPERIYRHYLELQEEYKQRSTAASESSDRLAPAPPVRSKG